jgi:hypothetical protein
MALSVKIEVQKSLEVTASFEEAIALVADVPRSVSHFPRMEELVPLGDNTYRWDMQKLGPDKYSVQIVYACKYTSDLEAGRVTWTPVSGVGNGQIAGSWEISNTQPVRMILHTEGELTLPFPRLMRRMVEPFVQKEFSRLIGGYTRNLQKVLGQP